MKQKLHKELQSLFDFYQKQRQNLPDAFSYKAGVINKPSFFTVADLQRHLNNPLLQPEWVHVVLDGNRVKLEDHTFYKTVQLSSSMGVTRYKQHSRLMNHSTKYII